MFLDTIRNVYENAWPMLAIFLSIIVIVRLVYLFTNHKRIVIHQEILDFLFLVYILILFELLISTESASHGINLVPFKEITRYKFMSDLFIYNVIGNIILFIPFGFFVSRYCKLKNFIYIFFMSGLRIGRSFDIDDIILNVLGGLIGYFIYIGLTKVKKHLPKFLDNNLFYGIISVVILILVSYLFFHFIGLGWF